MPTIVLVGILVGISFQDEITARARVIISLEKMTVFICGVKIRMLSDLFATKYSSDQTSDRLFPENEPQRNAELNGWLSLVYHYS